MTNKITITFHELDEKDKSTIKEIIKKPFDQVTQKDLLAITEILADCRDSSRQDNEQYQMITYCLNTVLDSEFYRPMDQRSFIEYVINTIYDWVKEHLNYDGSTFEPLNVFNGYFADGTMTYNTQKALNYIRAFWDGFHEGDLEDTDAKFVFEKPEAFLVQQSYLMATRILETIFEEQETYNKQDFLNYVDNEFDINELFKLTNVIY